jgi:hypothetical protein
MRSSKRFQGRQTGDRQAVANAVAKWQVNDDFIRECEHRGRDVEAKSLGNRERR